MSSVRPVTEISDEFLQRHLPQVAEAGQGEAQHLRRDDAAEHQPAVHADADRSLELAFGDGEIGGAEHFRLIGAGDDADRERAGQEGRHADEAVIADDERRRRQQGRRAEIDEIDDQQLGQAAKHGRIGLAGRPREPVAGEPRPGDQRADHGADQEPAGGDEQRHAGAGEQRQPPSALAETEDAETVHAARRGKIRAARLSMRAAPLSCQRVMAWCRS